jgi:hypothetical protein
MEEDSPLENDYDAMDISYEFKNPLEDEVAPKEKNLA